MLLTACKQKTTYYYSEDGKNRMTIEEVSDSAAYMKAFFNFQVSKKLYKDEKAVNPTIRRKEPQTFSLSNHLKQEITTTVQFQKKDSLENSVIHKMKLLPNYFLKKLEDQRKSNKQVPSIQ
jgi:hypothetical protein